MIPPPPDLVKSLLPKTRISTADYSVPSSITCNCHRESIQLQTNVEHYSGSINVYELFPRSHGQYTLMRSTILSLIGQTIVYSTLISKAAPAGVLGQPMLLGAASLLVLWRLFCANNILWVNVHCFSTLIDAFSMVISNDPPPPWFGEVFIT